MRKKEGVIATAASFICAQELRSGGWRQRSQERVLKHGDRELRRCRGEPNTRDIEGVWRVIDRCARFELGAPQCWHRQSLATKWAALGERPSQLAAKCSLRRHFGAIDSSTRH